MSEKLDRRQLLKLLALATGTSAVAYAKLNSYLKTKAQYIGIDVFLPFITSNKPPTATPTSTATATPTSTATATPTSTATATPTSTATSTSTVPADSTATPTPTSTATATPTPPAAPGTFTDGPGGDVDTGKDLLMSSIWATRNGGLHANFQLEGPPGAIQHALLEFNLSSLPSSYTCVSAKLYLYHSYPPEGGEICIGNVYSISNANSSWIEGTGNIDPAQQGEPCWNALESDGNGGVQTAWAGSPGCSTSGVDYEANSMGTWSFSGNSPAGTEIVIDLDIARVQGWFGNTNINYGIILISDNNHGVHVGSAENATSGYRPKLVVTYE